tara:strand:- start:50337 stop:51095 length:759 start_codon:yes stop_codon:yes gene_type:complete
MLKDKLDLLYRKQFEELGSLEGTSIQIITVGNDVASEIYVRNKIKLLEKLNCRVVHTKLEANITQDKLNDQVYLYGREFTGQFVQLPLPEHLKEPDIPAFQDVDGFNSSNKKVLPCTVQACLDIIQEIEGDIKGKNIAILGRSNIVGLPLVVECIKLGGTVSSFNSNSVLPKKWDAYDIVVSATGNRFLTAEEFQNVNLVVDVGIHRVEGKVCGDIIHEKNKFLNSKNITPVPFGVGRFTVLNVARNLKKIK